jgi:hypothetical protein
LLAIEILAISDARLFNKYKVYKLKIAQESRDKNLNPEFTQW